MGFSSGVGEVTPRRYVTGPERAGPGCAAPGVGIVTGMEAPGGRWLLLHGTPLTPQI